MDERICKSVVIVVVYVECCYTSRLVWKNDSMFGNTYVDQLITCKSEPGESKKE